MHGTATGSQNSLVCAGEIVRQKPLRQHTTVKLLSAKFSDANFGLENFRSSVSW